MRTFVKALVLALLVLPIYSCSDDDDGAVVVGPTGNEKVFDLGSVSDPNISGTATFIEMNDGTTTIELQLSGTPDGGMHPAHIHFNTAAETGGIALSLGTVDGSTGLSTVTTRVLDMGDEDPSNDTPISYDELLDFDGYINVHASADDLGTLVAQGDIGQNELTGNSRSYALNSVAVPTISGTIEFEERANGNTIATIMLTGTPDGGMHPAHIHAGSVAEAPGDILFTFKPVDGTTGISKTNMDMPYTDEDDDDDNDGTEDPITYSEILDFDGYVNVHLSSDDLGTLVAQGNIGANN